jgi:ElaB/YqjD/DUF883 family membrane-anchored ribosome-binding protein
MNEIRPS